MSTQTLIPEEVRTRGMKALVKELGPAGMMQFMQQFRRGRGDYTKERHKYLDGLTVRQIADEMRRERQTYR